MADELNEIEFVRFVETREDGTVNIQNADDLTALADRHDDLAL